MIKSQRPQFLDDYGLWLFSCFAEKMAVFQLCKLQIWTEIIKSGKERNHMLIRLLRLIRTVLAEIVGVLLRKTVLA